MLKMEFCLYLKDKENSCKSTLDFLNEVNNYGVSRIIYTDINQRWDETKSKF